MAPAHKSMRIIAANRMPPCPLDCRSRAAGATARSTSEWDDADQAKRLAAVRQGAGGVFHRHGEDRSAVRGARTGACSRRERDVRAGRPNRLAYPPAWPDADRHRRLRLDPVLGRTQGGNPAWGRHLLSARQEALARRDADDGDDPYRHPGGAERQGRRLDGKGQRRAVPRLTWKETKQCRSANLETADWKSRPSDLAAWGSASATVRPSTGSREFR